MTRKVLPDGARPYSQNTRTAVEEILAALDSSDGNSTTREIVAGIGDFGVLKGFVTSKQLSVLGKQHARFVTKGFCKNSWWV